MGGGWLSDPRGWAEQVSLNQPVWWEVALRRCSQSQRSGLRQSKNRKNSLMSPFLRVPLAEPPRGPLRGSLAISSPRELGKRREGVGRRENTQTPQAHGVRLRCVQVRAWLVRCCREHLRVKDRKALEVRIYRAGISYFEGHPGGKTPGTQCHPRLYLILLAPMSILPYCFTCMGRLLFLFQPGTLRSSVSFVSGYQE